MKRRRVISDNEISDPEEGRSPVKVKVEPAEREQEAQGPDTTMIDVGHEEIGNKPSPTAKQPTIPEEPGTTIKVLAEKELEEGKV